MKTVLTVLGCLLLWATHAQSTFSVPAWSMLHGLNTGDSIYYYQCFIVDPLKEPQIATDYADPHKGKKFSITDKFVVIKSENGYRIRHYRATIKDYPNRKFSGLKVREKDYWYFNFVNAFEPTDVFLKRLLRIERQGHEATEYDFALTHRTPQQVMFRRGKDFKQLIPQENIRDIADAR